MNNILFSSKSDEWATPQNLFDVLNKSFNFTLDPCATKKNKKCDKYYTIKDNGLIKSWKNETIFCNPPYSNIKEWVKKCFYENKENNVEIVLLVPSRTDTKWFHDYIYYNNNATILFLKGRLKFNDEKGSAPFPSMLVHFKRSVRR